ncbi:MAG: hypothetical protein JNM25_19185 [Planctomycetes bacterium]|nr:hypothetical protein [Planctomycetota bacterium]
MRLPLFAVFALALPLAAQEELSFASRFRIQFAGAGGELEHRTDNSLLDGETDAGLFRFQFEGISRRGFGGGLRFEGIGSDDDLFADAGFNASEARSSSLYLHFTYRATARRFTMPVRFGLWLNGYVLEDRVLGDEVTYGSIGPYLELAPEFRLVDRRRLTWSLYGELGAGVAGTGIDVDNDSNDYYSSTISYGVELGTRLRTGPFELGIAYVLRGQAMDESDPENGLVVLGYDSQFRGLLISASVLF